MEKNIILTKVNKSVQCKCKQRPHLYLYQQHRKGSKQKTRNLFFLHVIKLRKGNMFLKECVEDPIRFEKSIK